MTDILDTLADLDEDSEGFDISHELDTLAEMGELEAGDMSEARAVEITEAIRSAATVTFILLSQAHQHNAHKALGYSTWAEYVKEEFDMSAQRSYQLLDLSKVINEIETVVPEGTEVKLTEAQARDIKRELPMVTEKIREAVEGGETPEEAVDRIVAETREQKKADEKEVAKKQEKMDAAAREAYQQGLESAADSMLENAPAPEDRGTPLDVEVEEGPSLSPEDSMSLYNFFNVLSALESLPEPDDFIKLIPSARVEEVNEVLLTATSWLNRFQTIWEIEKGE